MIASFLQIISIIVKNDDAWLANQHSLVSQLRRVWVSETFQERHRRENMAATNWKEPKLLAFCLLNYCKWVHWPPLCPKTCIVALSLMCLVYGSLDNVIRFVTEGGW